ncbi:MAG: DUF5054 domain-containing protein, partial [Acidobacteriaceae bacterium]|nr:DUF5054 domain-containing protein [Acidobacteriaceae bacterium]
MERRDFVKSAVALGGMMAWDRGALSAQSIAPSPDKAVTRVLVMFKCHLDVGFTNTQAVVLQRYFKEYFPQAIDIAARRREQGQHRYVWTTGSWLLYEYLEQASASERKAMEQAIASGDITWHALPFTWQTEMLDRSMISGSLALSSSLDRRFGRTTTGAKMTDVPGHTRGLIGPLADGGVKFLNIGVNPGSRTAELPPFFRWVDSRGKELIVMYHSEYGSVAVVPDSDLAIAIVVRLDNTGPHTEAEIEKTYADLAQRFTNAEIKAASLTDIANAVEPYRKRLPVIVEEIGDTWIYGVASDPMKIARYRELARLRQSWIKAGRFQLGDGTDVALLRHLLLAPEHTWGTDTDKWLDYDHYTPQSLVPMLTTKNYQVVQHSWEEKRQDISDGIAALPVTLQTEAQAAVSNLTAKEPQLGHKAILSTGKVVETERFILRLDESTGAIARLFNKATGREWASADHLLGLFTYQTLSQKDYARFMSRYVTVKEEWAIRAFGKHNMERYGAVSREWQPSLVEVKEEENSDNHRLVVLLQIRDARMQKSGVTAFPEKMYMELILPKKEPVIQLNYSWFQKPAT